MAETTRERSNDQRRILLTVMTWGAALGVMIVSQSWLAVSQGLCPLNRVREAISRRSLRDLLRIK